VSGFLDHASVSPLRNEVVETLRQLLELPQADPGRPYDDALVVRRLIEESRQAIAELARVTPRQVVFTGSIPESAATAIHGLAQGGAVALAQTERASVISHAEATGRRLDVPVDQLGHLELGALEELLSNEQVDLVCCQLGNHETGSLDDARAVVELAQRSRAKVHVDATMAFGKIPVDFGVLEADAVSVAGELLGGPMGCAALIVKKGSVLPALLLGGSQERGRRAGLENLLGIVGMGVAASVLAAPGVLAREAEQAAAQIALLESAALAVEGVEAVGDPDPVRRVPHLRCFTVAGVEAEPVLMGLNRVGVSVHSGSACASECFEPSPVLAAMGAEADRSMRLSVGWSTTQEDLARFAQHFGPVVESLRALGRSAS
jgi:cysteine desulfurase